MTNSVKDYIPAVSRPNQKRFYIYLASLVLIATLLSLPYRIRSYHGQQHYPQSTLNSTLTVPTPETGASLEKPNGLKVIGLVFYGRRFNVEILDCYLRKNLVRNGGWLDEVRFIAAKSTVEDIAWIEDLVPMVPEYNLTVLHGHPEFYDYWLSGSERGAVIVKMDDDLIWMDKNAIPEIVRTLLRHPTAVSIIGNIINSVSFGWLHNHLEVIHTYHPEPQQPSVQQKNPAAYGPAAWRASVLPTLNFTAASLKEFWGKPENSAEEYRGPYHNHRWLPLRDNDRSLSSTPAWNIDFRDFGYNYRHWQSGAQVHYSFLQNLESQQLSHYYFGSQEGLWNLREFHANINFMAIRGEDVFDIPRGDNFDTNEDEKWFTMWVTQVTGRPVYLQSRALVAHFSFSFQQSGMLETDLMGRYRAYANEMVCPPEQQIPIRETWPGFEEDEDMADW